MRIRTFISAIGVIGAEAGVIMTESGPVVGDHVVANTSLNAAIMQDVNMYIGIPFADPPVGELRFKPPARLSRTWTEPLLATKQVPSCGRSGQEDCLYLNVFVPSTPSDTPRAVLMWIYGGGFTSGSVSDYNGTALAASEDVIVVMANYRLGMLGFLASEQTMQESGTTGNWGLLDQVAAMEWVQRNIRSFGGDPERVTIFGESAGAMSVVAHLMAPVSKDLFSAAIIQSGTTNVEMFFQPRDDAEKYAEWFAKTHLNCPGGLNDMDCLRRVPSSRFWTNMSERDGWGAPTWSSPIFPVFTAAPVIDGVVLTDSPHVLAKRGEFASSRRIPIIIGTTSDEGTPFTLALRKIVRPIPEFPPLESELPHVVNYIIQNQTVADNIVNTEFPLFRDKFARDGVRPFREAEFAFISHAIRNVMFSCPTSTFAEILSENGFPVYVYNFAFSFWPAIFSSYPAGGIEPTWGNFTLDKLGAFHSSEVPFLFKQFPETSISVGVLDFANPSAAFMTPPFSVPGDAKHAVSDMFSCAWAALAKTGNPNSCGKFGIWQTFTKSDPQFLLIGSNGTISMESIATEADAPIDIQASFLPMHRCNWYMDSVKTPFHDIRADLDLPDRPDPKSNNAITTTTKGVDNGAAAMALSVILLAYCI
jgi:carboxylesterase type B